MEMQSPILIKIYSIIEERIKFMNEKYLYDYNGLKYEFNKPEVTPNRYNDSPGAYAFFMALPNEFADIFNCIFDELHPY